MTKCKDQRDQIVNDIKFLFKNPTDWLIYPNDTDIIICYFPLWAHLWEFLSAQESSLTIIPGLILLQGLTQLGDTNY